MKIHRLHNLKAFIRGGRVSCTTGKRKSQSALANHLFADQLGLPLVSEVGIILVVALMGVMFQMINRKPIAPGTTFGRSAKIAIILFQLLLGRMRLWIAS